MNVSRGHASVRAVLLLGAVIVTAGCGTAPGVASPGVGSSPPGATSPANGTGTGVVTDPASPGEAEMVVAGQTLSFTDALACEIAEDSFNFVFASGDGQSQLRGSGTDFGDGVWGGTIGVYVADLILYSAPLTSAGMSVVMEEDSLVFVGPVGTTPDAGGPLPDGGLPTLKPLGEGTVRATCP